MEVIVAKNSGFCFGVKRAVDMVYSQIGHGNIYTFGPVIHNEEVIKDLENNGVKVINSVEEAADVPKGTVIIRAHGVPEHIYREILSLGHKVVDATCPFVLKIHNIVKEAAAKGEFVVIMGAAAGQCAVIDTEEKAEKFIEDNKNKLKKICIVSQTTFNYNKFKYLVEIFQKNSYDSVGILNTICNATEVRQTEAGELASMVDAMIVIGGRTSSNTQKLYDICKKVCKHTFYIQNADDMDYDILRGMDRVGITAGASTPNIIIEEVLKRCQI